MRATRHYRRRPEAWRGGHHLVTVYASRCDGGPLVRVVDGQSMRTQAGEIAARAWERIGKVFPGVTVDAYVVFPDRLVGILDLDRHGRPGPPPLPALIGWFRSASTRAAGRYVWRRGYDADALRDAAELDAVRRFLAGGASRWSIGVREAESEEVPPAA